MNRKDEYNSEPVVFCKHCLSLKIKFIDDGTDYCAQCGSTDMLSSSIENWEKLNINKYGKTN